MADDQGSKTQTIDDLMKELTNRSPSTQTPPKTANPFPSPRPPTGATSPTPSPTSPTPPPSAKPAPAPLPQQPGGYQSSIRTMSDDISRLNQGQKPAGISVPRKIEPTTPTPIKPVELKVTLPPVPPPAGGPVQPRPMVPPSQFKVPQVSLGEAQKSATLPQSRMPPVPPTQKESKPSIYVPEVPRGGGNRKMLFGGIAVLVVLAGVLYWFLVLKPSNQEIVEESPTPIPTEVMVPKLADIFSGTVSPITVDRANLAQSLREKVEAMDVTTGTFAKVSISDSEGLNVSLNDLVAIPQEVKDGLGLDFVVLVYGQREAFDGKGMPVTPTKSIDKLALVFEVKDRTLADQAMHNWEKTMAKDLQVAFSHDVLKESSKEFLDNYYQGNPIRYKNFSYPDSSIDYAIVLGSNANNYLVISSSRESIYAAIDKIKGRTTEVSPSLQPVPSGK